MFQVSSKLTTERSSFLPVLAALVLRLRLTWRGGAALRHPLGTGTWECRDGGMTRDGKNGDMDKRKFKIQPATCHGPRYTAIHTIPQIIQYKRSQSKDTDVECGEGA